MGEARKQIDPDKDLFQDVIVSDNLSGTTCGTRHPAMFSCEIAVISTTLFIGLSAFIPHLPLPPHLLSRDCTSLKKAVTTYCLKLALRQKLKRNREEGKE